MKLQLLSAGKLNSKIGKNTDEKYIIWSLNLRPAVTMINGKPRNLCTWKGTCEKFCVGDNGHFGMIGGSAYKAQLRKTLLFWENRQAFFTQLFEDIKKCILYAKKKDSIAVFRLNAYSDLNFQRLFKRYLKIENVYNYFSEAIFYDYTKDVVKFANNTLENYHVTFSYSERVNFDILEWIKTGRNISIVFEAIPDNFLGYKVIDGDKDDNRFLDQKGVIVGLKFKGSKRKLLAAIATGFCIPRVLTHKSIFNSLSKLS